MEIIKKIWLLTIAHPEFAIFWTAVGALVSIYLTHRLALRRDRKKQRIDVLDRVRERLMAREPISAIEEDRIARRIPRWRREGLRRAVAEYKRQCSNHVQDEAGQAFSANPKALELAANKLLKYTDEI